MTVDVREVEQFLYFEASLLDSRRYDEWLDLFTEDASYWLPSGDPEADPQSSPSLIFDDRRALGQRATRLLHPSAHSQTPPSRTSRVIGNVRLEEIGADETRVHSTFGLFESRLGVQRVFGGRAEHLLRRVDGTWRIASKKVDLINSDGFLNNLTFMF
jgi:3-phenylpropionate/cinnamic acid dioxygenase small subunit